MPLIGTQGAASSRGFGEFAKAAVIPVSTGLTATISNGTDAISTYQSCSDPAGNVWVPGVNNTQTFLAQFDSSGNFVKSFYISGSSTSGVTYYNGNIYWMIPGGFNRIIYFPYTISAGTQSVNMYTGSTLNQFSNIRFDTSGNVYLVDYSYRFAKLNSSFAFTYRYNVTPEAGFSSSGLNAYLSVNNSYHFAINNSSTGAVGLISVDSSGALYNLFNWTSVSGSISNAIRTSDSSGNTYSVLAESSNYIYVIKQSATGTTLWSKTYSKSLITGSFVGAVVDGNYLYIYPSSTGPSQMFAVDTATGATIVWYKSYSALNVYSIYGHEFASNNPIFTGSYTGATTFVSPPRSTGGKNGTYAGNTISTATGITVTDGVSRLTQTSGTSTLASASTIALSSSSVTINGSATITVSSASIPIA